MLSCFLQPLRPVVACLSVFCGLAFLGLAPLPPAAAQVPVLTQNRDNARTGANPVETVLTPDAVSSGNFGHLFTISGLNANVNGQPLYVPRVALGGVTRNVLCVYTSNNTDNSPCGLYAYDADTGAQLWADVLPNSATYTTATPVVDPTTNIIYVLTKTGNDDTGATFLHAFDLITGHEMPGSPVQVHASAPGTGDGNVNGVVSFDGPASSGRFHANDRAALLLLNGVVYAAFAHNSDSYPYHGWVLGYQYSGGGFTQKYVFCTTPDGGDGGVWMSGKGLTADQAGNIYLTVGNGTFDANTKGNTPGTDYGMCYLKLSPSLQVEDYFSPYDEQSLSNADLDTGNSGMVGIGGTDRLFGGGTKFGSGFLLDSTALGEFTPGGPDHVVLRINGLSSNGNVGQNPISWDTGLGAAKYVYLWPDGTGLEQFDYDPSAGTFNPAGIARQNTSLTSGGSLAVSSSGGSGGILWAVGNNGTLSALDATDVSKSPLWSGSFGSPGHFQFPTVTNGKVYVPTGSATIAVFGLTSGPPITGAARVVQVRYAPRPGWEQRMVGGQFQGSNDDSAWTTLATITQTPPAGQWSVVPVSNTAPYRYLRYLAPDGAYGNIAELEFDGGTASSPVKLVGVPFGTPGSWSDLGNDYIQAFDGNPATFFDAPAPGNGDFVGIDRGTGGTTPVGMVRYAPRPGWEQRMVGGQFQGSNDDISWTTLATVTQTPPAGQWSSLPLPDPTAYRYLRYLAPDGAYGNIAEVEFDSNGVKLAGTGFGTAGSWSNDGNVFGNALDGDLSTFFDAPAPGNGDFVGIDRGAGTGGTPPVTGTIRYAPRVGWEQRMVGGQFQGSSDGTSWTTLYTVASAPAAGQWTSVTVPVDLTQYRYLRYLAPEGAYGNVAEIEFDGASGKLTGAGFGTAGSWSGNGNVFSNALDGNLSTFFDAPAPGNGDFVGIQRY